MHGGEPARQRGDQVGVGDDGKGEHEVRDGQRDPARPSLLGEDFVDEAVGIACVRDDEMLHLAIAIQGRRFRKRMSGAHRDDEVFFVKRSVMEARRDVVEGDDRDVHGARLQVGECNAPGALG